MSEQTSDDAAPHSPTLNHPPLPLDGGLGLGPPVQDSAATATERYSRAMEATADEDANDE
jgi:hypothetical protein